MIRSFLVTAAVVAAAAISLGSTDASAQVSAADGAAFLGEWHLPLDAGGQMIELQIDIEDADGMLDVEVSSPIGGESEVDRVRLSDGALRLNYSIDMQGQTAPIEIRLTPSGEKLDAHLDMADGMFTVDGVASKH